VSVLLILTILFLSDPPSVPPHIVFLRLPRSLSSSPVDRIPIPTGLTFPPFVLHSLQNCHLYLPLDPGKLGPLLSCFGLPKNDPNKWNLKETRPIFPAVHTAPFLITVICLRLTFLTFSIMLRYVPSPLPLFYLNIPNDSGFSS